MSRIGKNPIEVTQGVEVKIDSNLITVKGKNGELTQDYDSSAVTIKLEDGVITLERASDHKDHRSKHGLYRALIANMIEGVSQGFTKKLEFHGVGYRATAKGNLLEMVIGFSHPVVIELPTEVKFTAETEKGQAPVVTLTSHDKQLLGQVAAKIRSLRKPEPYKGKGIRYTGEYIRRKAGKSASS
ncbi:50S ribosomal protein L6 [Paracrocinitomix mangrovi]|uniref:50S ribosomal protein L6 n=1 Tax=Paracrocinitomix mangrovi TaxID=2862509 RepID=UPI001C8D8DCA|nr:50S ribosomal protein L6 [Paracrocinitomix mangrovi]UKN03168.1 50S ribosomal protein L6 [Paracrocinitomix mangrovi]